MFISHIPAGYLLANVIDRTIQNHGLTYKSIITIGLISSIFPDLDLLYFYLIDNRQHSHHSYWTHIPFFWLIIYTFCVISFKLLKNNKITIIIHLTGLEIFLHLILDSFVGEIKWFYPLSNQYFSLFQVPAIYDWWVLNFILHWSFTLELLITITALRAYLISRKKITHELTVVSEKI